jgi:hypothetical protein
MQTMTAEKIRKFSGRRGGQTRKLFSAQNANGGVGDLPLPGPALEPGEKVWWKGLADAGGQDDEMGIQAFAKGDFSHGRFIESVNGPESDGPLDPNILLVADTLQETSGPDGKSDVLVDDNGIHGER